MKFCIYVRMCNEEPFIDFFIDYYLKLGFDKIIILNSGAKEYTYQDSRVLIHKVPNIRNELFPKYIDLVKKSQCQWVFVIDTDEFLILHKKYQTIKDFVKDKLKINKFINVFQFRWLMIEKLDNEVSTFEDTVKKYKKYPDTHIKSLTKISNLLYVGCHCSKLKIKPFIFLENKCLNKMMPNNHKVTKETYVESALVHIHTRSMNELIRKAFQPITEQKSIASLRNFKQLISKPIDLDSFKKSVGSKASLPFSHSNNFSNDTANIVLDNFTTNYSDIDFVNTSKLNSMIKDITSKYNIDYEQYCRFVKNLITKINEIYSIKN